jgi:ribosomal-protein-alanine N-acetyltransferase
MTASSVPRGLTFRPFTPADARAIADWRYGGEYAVYDHGPESAEALLDPAYEYYAAVAAGGELVGYCCFGADARVPGLAPEDGTLDVGGGLRPDLTGIGLGGGFLRATCNLGRELHAPRRFRVVVAAFNRRAQRVAAALGFERAGTHSTADCDYVVLARDA